MKHSLLIGTLALFTTSVTAQTDVTVYQPGVTPEGITYYMPRTAVRMVITAEKNIYTPGEYAKYAERYLRQQITSTTPSTTWTIKHIDIYPYGVPDPSKIYSVKLKKKTIAPLVTLSEEGILLGINTETGEEALPPLPLRKPATPCGNPKDYMTQEMLTAGSNAKVAELVAQAIYDIRESRNDLVSGNADNMPKDGAQLKLMLEQLQLQETTLMQLFKGTNHVSTEIFSIDFVPEKEMNREILFRFSQRLGLVDANDLAGSPVYVTLTDLKTVPEPVVDEKAEKKKKKTETGVYYNVPGRAELKVFTPETTYATQEISMGQFGNVELLSNVLFDKDAKTKITFYQSNGGIQHIEGTEQE